MSKQFKVGLVLRLIVLACMCVGSYAAYHYVYWLAFVMGSVSVVGMLCFTADEFKREIRQ